MKDKQHEGDREFTWWRLSHLLRDPNRTKRDPGYTGQKLSGVFLLSTLHNEYEKITFAKGFPLTWRPVYSQTCQPLRKENLEFLSKISGDSKKSREML